MEIKLGLLKQLINEEAQKLDERYKVTRDDVKTLQKGLNIFFVGDDVDEDAPDPGDPGFDEYVANMKNKVSKELKVDGIFGKNTRADLMDFQEIAGLTQDGVAGPKTFRSLALEIRDTSDGMPDTIKDEYEKESLPIAADLDRLSGEKALMGRRRRRKKPKPADKKPAVGGKKATPSGSAEENKAEMESQARRALIQAEKLGAEVIGDRTGADGAPLAFIIDRPDAELEAGANSVTADKLKDLMMKVFFGTSRMLDMKDIEVEILDPKKVDAAVRPAELKGKIRLTVTGPAREKGSGPLSDEEAAKLFEATEKLRVLREARRRK
jgi:hypothetical protein